MILQININVKSAARGDGKGPGLIHHHVIPPVEDQQTGFLEKRIRVDGGMDRSHPVIGGQEDGRSGQVHLGEHHLQGLVCGLRGAQVQILIPCRALLAVIRLPGVPEEESVTGGVKSLLPGEEQVWLVGGMHPAGDLRHPKSRMFQLVEVFLLGNPAVLQGIGVAACLEEPELRVEGLQQGPWSGCIVINTGMVKLHLARVDLLDQKVCSGVELRQDEQRAPLARPQPGPLDLAGRMLGGEEDPVIVLLTVIRGVDHQEKDAGHLGDGVGALERRAEGGRRSFPGCGRLQLHRRAARVGIPHPIPDGEVGCLPDMGRRSAREEDGGGGQALPRSSHPNRGRAVQGFFKGVAIPVEAVVRVVKGIGDDAGQLGQVSGGQAGMRRSGERGINRLQPFGPQPFTRQRVEMRQQALLHQPIDQTGGRAIHRNHEDGGTWDRGGTGRGRGGWRQSRSRGCR